MDNYSNTIKKRILDGNVVDFEDIAVNLFRYQYANNQIYRQYIDALGIDTGSISESDKIPYLPISAFKHHRVISGEWNAQAVFISSGTTAISNRSHHYVKDTGFYLAHARHSLSQLCNIDLDNTVLLACLPSYHEQRSSSLVAMIDDFIQQTGDSSSGFYKDDFEALDNLLSVLSTNNKTVVLFGVTYALLDFFEKYPRRYDFLNLFVTGGMKGRRVELTPSQLFDNLAKYVPVSQIYGEYGMTELLSQAYSKGDFRYHMPDTMQVSAVEITDPMKKVATGKTGLLRIIDLANIDSCSFVQTDDLCRIYADGTFEILGRLDHSDIRGCSLLTA